MAKNSLEFGIGCVLHDDEHNSDTDQHRSTIPRGGFHWVMYC